MFFQKQKRKEVRRKLRAERKAKHMAEEVRCIYDDNWSTYCVIVPTSSSSCCIMSYLHTVQSSAYFVLTCDDVSCYELILEILQTHEKEFRRTCQMWDCVLSVFTGDKDTVYGNWWRQRRGRCWGGCKHTELRSRAFWRRRPEGSGQPQCMNDFSSSVSASSIEKHGNWHVAQKQQLCLHCLLWYEAAVSERVWLCSIQRYHTPWKILFPSTMVECHAGSIAN